jgi:hypothetical protein
METSGQIHEPKVGANKKKKQSTTETSSQIYVRATKQNINEHNKKNIARRPAARFMGPKSAQKAA